MRFTLGHENAFGWLKWDLIHLGCVASRPREWTVHLRDNSLLAEMAHILNAFPLMLHSAEFSEKCIEFS